MGPNPSFLSALCALCASVVNDPSLAAPWLYRGVGLTLADIRYTSCMSSIRDTARGVPPTVDARAPRFNQAIIGAAALAAYLLGWWPLLGLAALQLGLALSFGPRACLGCLIYFKLVRPRVGGGAIKDARPVRFANLVGLVFLSAACAAQVAGYPRLGWTLGLVVAGLALVAAVGGFCAGCEMYRLLARLRRISFKKVSRVDLAELGATPVPDLVVQFTYPRCTDCRELEARLRQQGVPLALVDVSQRPDLARKYGIDLVPFAVQVDLDGRVLAQVTA